MFRIFLVDLVLVRYIGGEGGRPCECRFCVVFLLLFCVLCIGGMGAFIFGQHCADPRLLAHAMYLTSVQGWGGGDGGD